MSAFAVITILVGVILGQRFKVLILLPATLVASFVAIGFGLMANAEQGVVVFSIIAGAIGLQLGYLAGAVLRYVIAASRAGRLHQAGRRDARFASSTSR